MFAVAVASMPQFASAQCGCDGIVDRPIELGGSGGNIHSFFKNHTECGSGTLGSMVQDADSNQFILSCNHVFSRNVDNGKVGDLIVQPGLASSQIECRKTPADAVATFTHAAQVKFGGASNTIDAAIAAVEPGDVSSDIANVGAIASTTVDASPGLAVQKMGSCSCLTTGTISAIGAHGKVSYGGGKVAKFVDQILINVQNFGEPGDSGSLIVTQESCPQAVGLLFAGSADGSQTIANPISDVLSKLNVSMVGGCTAATSSPQASEVAGNIGMSKTVTDSASAVRDRHEDQLMNIPGAVGTAIGISDQPGKPAIEVYLKKMTPEAKAAAPKTLEGVPVKLIENGGFVAY
jgi:hypothetical protein